MKDKTTKAKLESPLKPAIELLSDGLEVVLDTNITDEVLKDIPIFGSLLKINSAYQSIRDARFFRKVSLFLHNLGEYSEEQRAKFWEKQSADEEGRKKLAEQIIVYLDRYDTDEKAVLLARSFGAYMLGQIDKHHFLDLAIMIESLKIHYLVEIVAILPHLRDGSYSDLPLPRNLKAHISLMESLGLLLTKNEIEVKRDRNSFDKNKLLYSNHLQFTASPLGINFFHYVIRDQYDDECKKVDDYFEINAEVARKAFKADMEYKKEREERIKNRNANPT